MRLLRTTSTPGARLLPGVWLLLGCAGVAAEPDVQLQLQVKHGEVTLKARNAPLMAVVRQLAEQSGWRLHSPALEGLVTQNIAALSQTQALRQVLGHRGFMLQASASLRDPDGEPAQLWIVGHPAAPGQRAAVASGHPAQTDGDRAAFLSLRDTAINHSDPVSRMDAAADLAGYEAVAELELLLADSDPRVREAAVEALADIGDERVHQALLLAADDVSGNVRQEAGEALRDLGLKSPRVSQ